MTPGPLIIVSGPSGSGKSTLIRYVLNEGKYPLRLAVSATTRQRREGEQEGVDYYFWSRESFLAHLAAGDFLEHAQVHGVNYYGTPRSEVDEYRKRGQGVILDIDVQGAAQVRAVYPDHVSVFIKLSSWEMYRERLQHRGSETEESIARRLETARKELARSSEYQHEIINDHLTPAVQEFLAVIGRHFPNPQNA